MLNTGRLVFGLLLTLLSTKVAAAGDEGVQWLTDAPTALQQATASGRPVLIKFTASWCGPCRRMEAETFHDPHVVRAVHQGFVPLLLDGDEHKDLAARLQIRGFPALLIVAPDMTELQRIMGFQPAKKLLPQLETTLASFRSPVAAGHGSAVAAAPRKSSPTPASPASQSTTTAVRAVAAAHPLNPAFDGLCLPSVVTERSLVKGVPQVRGEYRGRLLFFRSEQQKQLFFRNPEPYWPMLDGTCAMTLLQTGQAQAGQLKYAAVFRERVWLFASRELMQEFVASPADHVGRLSSHLAGARKTSASR